MSAVLSTAQQSWPATVTITSSTNPPTGSVAPITMTISGRGGHTMSSNDWVGLYPKEIADVWTNQQPETRGGQGIPSIVWTSVPMTDPANVTLTPTWTGLKAAALGVPSGSPLQDGEYCIIYMLIDEYERFGQTCFTQGAGGSLASFIADLEEAAQDIQRRYTNLIVGAVVGGCAVLLLLWVLVCRWRKWFCFKRCAKSPSAV